MSKDTGFEKLLASGQDNALVRYTLGSLSYKQQAYPQAIEHLNKALEFDPQYSAAWKLLARTIMESGDLVGAETVISQGLKVATDRGDQQVVRELQVLKKRLEKSK